MVDVFLATVNYYVPLRSVMLVFHSAFPFILELFARSTLWDLIEAITASAS
jgi:hypothetical protein